MTLNYYLTQQLLEAFFKNPENKKFFVKTIAPNPNNVQIFIEKEAYNWAVADTHYMETGKKYEGGFKEWEFPPVRITGDIKESSEWNVIFVHFPSAFVSRTLDACAIAIAFKETEKPEDCPVRIFIYELGASATTGQSQFYACEREIETGIHLNYGCVDQFSMQHFHETVMKQLNK